MACKLSAFISLFVACNACAVLVQPTNRIDWVAGWTVGSQLARTNRTTLVNVTNFGADASGVTNSSPAILDAIVAAKASAGATNVIFFPAGRYRIVGQLSLPDASYSGLTLRGETNANGVPQSILFGNTSGDATILYVGPGDNPSVYYPITNGATKGSTNLVLGLGYVPNYSGATVTNIDAALFSSGYIVEVAGDNGSNPEWQVISTGGQDHNAFQQCYPVAVSGQTITISSPLVMNFSATRNLSALIKGTPPIRAVSIEFLKFMATNTVAGEPSIQQNLITLSHAVNSWVIGCEFEFQNNYSISLASCVNVTVQRNKVHKGNTAGSNHGGLLMNASSCLVEDNIFADGLQPAIEINGGMGNAFFANYITNNIIDINVHNSHPAFNLFEANVADDLTLDGYFGSTSHHTFLRNRFNHGYVYLKRWSTFMQFIGNVIGFPTNTYTYASDDTTGSPVMFQFGKPNAGNESHSGTNPPVAWNDPGNSLVCFEDAGNGIAPGAVWTNGAFLITNAPTYPTNKIWITDGLGTLTNIPPPLSAGYALIFQDAANPNTYYSGLFNGPVLTTGRGNASNVTLNVSLQLSNGWRVFVSGSAEYQQLQTSNRLTHTIVSNLCFTNVAGVIVNDPIAVGVGSGIVSNSFLYAGGAPSWWGTNRWPAIQFDTATPVASIPAQDRYYGISGQSTNPPDAPTLSATACATSVRLTWTPNGQAADGYVIKRGTTSGMLTTVTNVGAQTAWTNTGLNNGTTYYFTITASNAYGFSSASSEVSGAPAAALGAPSGLSSVAGDQKVTLSWNTVSSATGYVVRRGTSSGNLSIVTIVSSLGYTNTGLNNGTAYFFDVATSNACSEVGSFTSETSATPSSSAGVASVTIGSGPVPSASKSLRRTK